MSESTLPGSRSTGEPKRTQLARIVKTIYEDLRKLEEADRTETVSRLSQEIDKNLDAAAANLEQAEELISPQFLNISVMEMARAASRYRKIEKRWGHADALDYLIPSTANEMLNDLLDARSNLALNILKGVIPFAQLHPESYVHLEAAWLRRVKAILAYCYWRAGSLKGPDADYFDASAEIRSWLLKRERSKLQDFDRVENYLTENYLTKSGLLDEKKAEKLIIAKARRIWETTGEQDPEKNWFRARLYIKLFYENIVGAVRSKDEKTGREKTAKILEAFEFSKSPLNRFLIINAFEAVLAIEFLDKQVIEHLKNSPAHNLNMVSVSFWPSHIGSRKSNNGEFRYDKPSRQIIYEGQMSVGDRDYLLHELEKETANKGALEIAVKHLYAQSQQVPFEMMIL